ncbi:hypothetical protein QWZ06_26220 [Chryseobacterium tructae]|uniref:Uncharacterized protein n=1 Tax=Chryseobacterium tructae TaxID=1037380 RepID=A0ABV7XSQ5_9FLAO|nr:hypothetical protein [Chryseobacterium tructae]MDN3695474.1 hypothetical protein [Chryseobacterium tructae]
MTNRNNEMIKLNELEAGRGKLEVTIVLLNSWKLSYHSVLQSKTS